MIEMNPQIAGSICFGGAVVHTFSCTIFARLAARFPNGSLAENILHYFAELEVVFGLWTIAFLGYLSTTQGLDAAVHYLDRIDFTDAAFVFVIMAMASTKPIMTFCSDLVQSIARAAPKNLNTSIYFLMGVTGAPLLGSLITEPAAMVVAALLLKPLVFDHNRSLLIRYSTLAVLLVNISLGGTLTHFAAPPVIMVATKWNWDLSFMFNNFGWKSSIVVAVNGLGLLALNFRELKKCTLPAANKKSTVPFWLFLSHALFIGLVVRYHGNMAFFIPLFLLFLGWTDVTKEHQDPLKLRESLLVGFFLGGLIALGHAQQWWIAPLIGSLEPLHLFLGAIGLTAITDNAALTFLGTLVPNLTEVSKYLLVAGAVAGGGLTVIANAPNPIAVGLLKNGFRDDSINAWRLLFAAIVPTVLACLGFWYL